MGARWEWYQKCPSPTISSITHTYTTHQKRRSWRSCARPRPPLTLPSASSWPGTSTAHRSPPSTTSSARTFVSLCVYVCGVTYMRRKGGRLAAGREARHTFTQPTTHTMHSNTPQRRARRPQPQPPLGGRPGPRAHVAQLPAQEHDALHGAGAVRRALPPQPPEAAAPRPD